MKAKKIKTVVVGYGHIGKRHADLILKNNHFELAGIVEPKPIVPDYLTHWPLLDDCLRETKDNEGEKVACICLPNGLHAKVAKQFLEHGFHVVIEKPMCISTSDGLDLIKCSLAMQKQIFVVKQNRYSPSVKWMKEMIDSERMGKILYVGMNCFWNRDSRYYQVGDWRGTLDLDGGTLFTQFSHFIDILYWVFGDVYDIQGQFSNLNHQGIIEFEDTGLVNFKLVSGGVGSINYSTAVFDKNLESSMTVIGEKGSFKIGGQYMNSIDYCHVKDYILPDIETNVPANQYGNYSGSAANHHYVFENIVNVLAGKESVSANANEGLKVVDIIERMYKGRDLNQL